MQNDDQDRGRLAAEDIKMQAKKELTTAAKMPNVENTATADDDIMNEPKLESVLDPGKLEVIPEGRMRMTVRWTMRCQSFK